MTATTETAREARQARWDADRVRRVEFARSWAQNFRASHRGLRTLPLRWISGGMGLLSDDDYARAIAEPGEGDA